MRLPALAIALSMTAASTGYALAAQQPLTRAACEAAGMPWDENANACAGGEALVPPASADGAAMTAAAGPQPLTRAACEASGMAWDDGANVCAGGAGVVPPPPMETAAVPAEPSGAAAAAAAAATAAAMPEPMPTKKVVKTTKKKVVKKHGHVTKKRVTKKAHVEQPAKRKRPILQWLKGKDNKS